jgi:hypothetical protein
MQDVIYSICRKADEVRGNTINNSNTRGIEAIAIAHSSTKAQKPKTKSRAAAAALLFFF